MAEGSIAAEELRLLIERIERLEEEKKAIADDVKDVYGEAKARGYDTKTMRSIVRQTALGTSFGAPIEAEAALAERICAALPAVDMLRFVNSGTEATMSAIRVARAATGRTTLVKFDGCYHGHADALLVQAGSGVATLGLPNSPGVTPGG